MTSTKRFLRHPLAAAIPLLLFIPGCAVDPGKGAPSIAAKVNEDPCARPATAMGGSAVAGSGFNLDQRRCALLAVAKDHNADVGVNPVIVPKGDLPAAANVAATTLPATGAATPFAAGSDTATAGLSVSVRDAGHQFAPGSDKLSPEAESLFRSIADQYSPAKLQARVTPTSSDDDRAAVEALKTRRVLLVGHTDDGGNSADNANLCERRAAAVARLFQQEGVPAANLFFQGAGETLPIADNHTEAGRAANRRMEIVDVGDDAAFRKYLATRRQSLQYYRGSDVAASDMAPVAPEPVVKGKAKGKAKEPPRGANTIDFGGVPAASLPVSTDFGTGTVGTPGTPAAGAANGPGGRPIVPTCSADRPRVANGVKALATQKDLPPSDYVPGLYNTSWSGTVSGNLIGLTNVDVLRDGGAAANKPTLLIWKNYNPKKKIPSADFQAAPEVNIYRGSNAILYRVFVTGPMKCMDVLFPYSDTGESRASSLFYERQSSMYVTSFELSR